MMKLRNRIRRGLCGAALRCCALAAVVLGAASASRAAPWWQMAWRYRRAVTVEGYRRTFLPGDDVAVATIYTGGKAKPDGSDIRVTTAGGRELACRVLMMGPGDRARVAFVASRVTRQYYVYFGHPNPPPAKKPLVIRRGVLLETRTYRGGGIKTFPQVRAAFERASPVLGCDFRRLIFLGHNPFGPQNRIASRFTGYLICQSDGIHRFACSSQDASFLLVDGKVVVANGGHHPPQRDISMQGSAHLTKGLHELTLYHINVLQDPIATAAWQPPGGKRIWTIPPGAFAPVFRTTPGAMEQYGKSMGIDFIPTYGGESFLRNRYYQRWVFQSLPVGQLGRKTELSWDFGDGQRATSPKVEHVYLVPGEYAVTLAAKTYRGELKQTHRIFVSRPWDEVTRNRLDRVGHHARIVAEYDFAKLRPEANAHAILLLDRALAAPAVRKAGAALVGRPAAPARLLNEALPIYAETVPPKQAVQAFLAGVKMTRSPAVQASLTQQAGRVALEGLNDTQQAMTLFQAVVQRLASRTSAVTLREAKIGIGDVWRIRGDYEEAKKAYAAAGLGARVNPARLAITKGDYARHVEDYLRKGDYAAAAQYVERWEGDIPLDKLEGYWSLLVARMHLQQKRAAEAAREAKVLVKVNPASNYAAQLLLLAAEAYAKLSRDAEARAALKQIIEKYPESPLVAEAKRRLPS